MRGKDKKYWTALAAAFGVTGALWANAPEATTDATGAGNPAVETSTAAQDSSAATPDSAVSVSSATASDVIGTVEDYSTFRKTLKIRDSSGEVKELKVDEGVQITRDGTEVKLSKLKKGDNVTVSGATPSTGY